MQLPFFAKKESVNKVFFGLFLKEKEAIGLVIRMKNSGLILDDEEKFSYSNGWENLTEDVDQVLLKLEQRTKSHLRETIFFVYSHFVDEKTKEIKKAYLHSVKDLVKKLDLKALGYIECYEAIVHFLEKKEELPLTAILIELDFSNLSVFVYKRGTLTYSKVIAHTDNLIDDLLSIFAEIKGKFLLPSRIILYNSKGLDDESTKIVTYRWSEELFIQLPRVEISKEHEIVQGLLGVFGEQISQKKMGVEFTEDKAQQEILGFVIGADIGEKEVSHQELVSPALSTIEKQAKRFEGIIIDTVRSFPHFFAKKLTIVLGIVFIFVGLFLNEYFFHKATLTIFLPSQNIKKDITLTNSDLKIETTSKTVQLTDSKATTGKKEIGEKARGSVTIHNFDDREKTFSKGTILETTGSKFSLDQDVKVASASVVTISGGLVKQPGKTKINVTAEGIGPQGNIASGKQLKIADLTTTLYFAMSDSAFSGGTKKELKTVAKKDSEDLKNKIMGKAKQQKLDQIDNKKDSATKILKDLTEISFVETKFDKELGEEADRLSLEAKVSAKLFFYKEKDLIHTLSELMKKDLQEGVSLEKDTITYAIKKVEEKDKKISANIEVQGKSIKDVSVKEVVKQVKGKNKNSLGRLLKEKFKAEGLELDIEPKLPFLQNRMPFFEKNISLKISSL